MILEIVNWQVKLNNASQFEQAFAKAQAILARQTGYICHQLQHCLENPNQYVLLVQWQDLEDHTDGFQQSRDYQLYRELINDYLLAGTKVTHYQQIKL